MPRNHFLRLMIIALALFQISASRADEILSSAESALADRDYRKAINLLQPVAEEDGYPPAQIMLGNIYKNTAFPTYDLTTAVKWYRLAADQGDANAQVKLGEMYEQGQGLPMDQELAFIWYRKAAESGNTEVQLKLAHMYESGDRVQQNRVEANNWYRKAAVSGSVEAQYRLGAMFEQDLNHREALEWYLKAAQQGEANAQFHLGEVYEQGQGVEPNPGEAVKWYQSAAEAGHASAQFKLGTMYAWGGYNMSRNYPSAHMWLNLAASGLPSGSDRDKAVILRDEIAGKMPPSQLATAREKAREWRPITMGAQ